MGRHEIIVAFVTENSEYRVVQEGCTRCLLTLAGARPAEPGENVEEGWRVRNGVLYKA